MINKRKIGKNGEEAVVAYLKENGYAVLSTNYQTRFGEIDIIAQEGEYYCFIEVKTRSSLEYGDPVDSVVLRKQHTIAKVAASYLMENDLDDVDIRFDIASVTQEGSTYKIDMMTNAFEVPPVY